MPRFSASIFATLVSAARQPDSEPICEKPMVRLSALAAALVMKGTATVAAKAPAAMNLVSLLKVMSVLPAEINRSGTFNGTLESDSLGKMP